MLRALPSGLLAVLLIGCMASIRVGDPPCSACGDGDVEHNDADVPFGDPPAGEEGDVPTGDGVGTGDAAEGDVAACIDLDGDDHGANCPAGPDCDDARADRWASCPPFRLTPGHPRLYVDSERVVVLRDAAAAGVPLNTTDFPGARGRLRFDLFPQPLAAPDYSGIFDRYDANRDHLFVRHHLDTTTGTELGIQVALQPSGGAQYVASTHVTVTYDTWHPVELAWNSVDHTASLTVDGVTTPLSWRTDGNGQPLDWQPDGQELVFRGPHGIDTVELYDADVGGALRVRYTFDGVTSRLVPDSSSNAHDALMSPTARIDARSAVDATPALWLDEGALLKVAAASLLTEAWLDSYANAVNHATRLIAGTHTVAPADDHPNGLISIARALGLAYLVTGEVQFRDAAWLYADLLLATPPDAGNDYTSAGRAEAMGILYDWFFADMEGTAYDTGASYADALRASILAHVDTWQAYLCGNGNPIDATWRCTAPPSPDFVSGHSHQNDTEMTAALMAIADESPEAESLLWDALDAFENGFNPARAWIAVDGGHHMGWSYAGTYTFLDSILLWQLTAGVPMQATWQAERIDSYIYGLRSDLRFPASGDGTFASPVSQQLAAFALWSAQRFGDAYAQTYYDTWIRSGATGLRDQELFLGGDAVPAAPLTDLPLSRHFANAGQVVMRESWDYADSTLVELKSTSFATNNHHHRDQNAFTLFYRAPLLIDSGDYDTYGSYHWHNYYTRTIAHNTITVWDANETFISGGNVVSNDGGQLIPPNHQLADLQIGGAWHLDGIERFEEGGDFSYTLGNASKAYSSTKLDPSRGFLRSLVFLRAPPFWSRPVVVVFDDVTATTAGAALTKRFLLHAVNEPEPLGGTPIGPGQWDVTPGVLRIQNGGGMVLVQTLLPTNPVIHKLGGQDVADDYRFLVPDATTGTLINIPLLEEPPPNRVETGAWRLEVSSATPAQHERFLHVLSVADDSATLPPPAAEVLTGSGGTVCLLGDTLMLAFADGATSTFETPVRGRVLVFGLPPTTAHEVTVVGTSPATVSIESAPNGSYVTSGAGVLDLILP